MTEPTRNAASVRELYERGDLLAAARREADFCDRDGYDVTAAILRDLADKLDAVPTDLQPHAALIRQVDDLAEDRIARNAEIQRLTEENARLRGHLEHALGAAETVEQVTGLATARACVFWIKECLNEDREEKNPSAV